MPVPRRRTGARSTSRPRGSVTPWIANEASAAWSTIRDPRAASLRACNATAPAPRACSHSAKKPCSMTESASTITIASHSISAERRMAAWRAGARPGSSPSTRVSTTAPCSRAISPVRSVLRSSTTSTWSSPRLSALIASSVRPSSNSSLWAGMTTRNRTRGASPFQVGARKKTDAVAINPRWRAVTRPGARMTTATAATAKWNTRSPAVGATGRAGTQRRRGRRGSRRAPGLIR